MTPIMTAHALVLVYTELFLAAQGATHDMVTIDDEIEKDPFRVY